jgi:hypothetical protein
MKTGEIRYRRAEEIPLVDNTGTKIKAMRRKEKKNSGEAAVAYVGWCSGYLGIFHSYPQTSPHKIKILIPKACSLVPAALELELKSYSLLLMILPFLSQSETQYDDKNKMRTGTHSLA